jgi:hypothetical protein
MLMNDWMLDAGIAAGWLVLFVGIALTLAYRRANLAAATAVFAVLMAAYWLWGSAPGWWKLLLSVPVALLLLLNLALPAQVPQTAAGHVRHRARGIGRGHGVVGR